MVEVLYTINKTKEFMEVKFEFICCKRENMGIA